jgi:glycyl-tRNA synthetase beta chain
MFGIGNAPTGEKDPFALRRAALGVISVYEVLAGRGGDAPDVREALAQAVGLFRPGLIEAGTADAVHAFVLERYRHALAAEYAKDAVDAVLSQRPRLAEVVSRVEAVERFRRLPEAESLAAANKRIRNILQKSPPATNHVFSETLLRDPAEQQL